MKKKLLIFFFGLTLITLSSSAQIEKGATYLGGNISVSNTNTKQSDYNTKQKQWSLSISPVIGKAIRKNLVAGISTGFSFSRYRFHNISDLEQKHQSYGLGVFLRKYTMIGKSDFSFFFHANLDGSYRTSITKTDAAITDRSRGYDFTLGAFPGLSYRLTRRIQLETGFANLISLNYFREKKDPGLGSYTNTANGFSIATSLSSFSDLYLGFRVLLN